MKFSVRDLLLATVIVALTVGWWVDRSRLEERRRSVEGRRILDRLTSDMSHP
jgi:hypothetical protein